MPKPKKSLSFSCVFKHIGRVARRLRIVKRTTQPLNCALGSSLHSLDQGELLHSHNYSTSPIASWTFEECKARCSLSIQNMCTTALVSGERPKSFGGQRFIRSCSTFIEPNTEEVVFVWRTSNVEVWTFQLCTLQTIWL